MADPNTILQLLAQKLNTDPSKLKQATEQNDASALTALLQPQQAQAVQKLLSDPNALKALLNSKQAIELQKKLNL